MSRIRREMYCGHESLRVSVCLSVRGRMPTLLHGPGCNLGERWGMPPSCALLGGFAIGAWGALLCQHNANTKCQRVHACTRCMPRYLFFTASLNSRSHRLRSGAVRTGVSVNVVFSEFDVCLRSVAVKCGYVFNHFIEFN